MQLSARFLVDLGSSGCISDTSVNFEGRLCSSIQDQTTSCPRAFDNNRLCKSPQEQLPGGGFAFTDRTEVIEMVPVQSSGLFEQIVPWHRTQQEGQAHFVPFYGNSLQGAIQGRLY